MSTAHAWADRQYVTGFDLAGIEPTRVATGRSGVIFGQTGHAGSTFDPFIGRPVPHTPTTALANPNCFPELRWRRLGSQVAITAFRYSLKPVRLTTQIQ